MGAQALQTNDVYQINASALASAFRGNIASLGVPKTLLQTRVTVSVEGVGISIINSRIEPMSIGSGMMTTSFQTYLDQPILRLFILRNQYEKRVRDKFSELMKAWKTERSATSSSALISMHPAYQRIIGLGLPAIPLILCELGRELDHWFWALKAITGEDPVPPKSRGKMKEMAEMWLEWGKKRGYVR